MVEYDLRQVMDAEALVWRGEDREHVGRVALVGHGDARRSGLLELLFSLLAEHFSLF